MNAFDVAAVLIVVAAAAGYLNHRLLRLPATSGTWLHRARRLSFLYLPRPFAHGISSGSYTALLLPLTRHFFPLLTELHVRPMLAALCVDSFGPNVAEFFADAVFAPALLLLLQRVVFTRAAQVP